LTAYGSAEQRGERALPPPSTERERQGKTKQDNDNDNDYDKQTASNGENVKPSREEERMVQALRCAERPAKQARRGETKLIVVSY